MNFSVGAERQTQSLFFPVLLKVQNAPTWQTLIIKADKMMMVISMSGSYKLVLLFLALFILSVSALAENPGGYTVNVSVNKFLGEYLVNQNGLALYYFSDDANANGASTCVDDCAVTWPPFYASVISLPDSLRSVDFATITRPDGSKQTTFKGWPLYLYSRDSTAGDTFGNGQKDHWHIVDPSNQPQLF